MNNKWIIVKFLKWTSGKLSWKKRIELMIIGRYSIKGKNNNWGWIVWIELIEGLRRVSKRGSVEKGVVWVRSCMKVEVNGMEWSENGEWEAWKNV